MSEVLTRLCSQLLDLCSQPPPTTTTLFLHEHLEIRKIVDEIRANQKPNDVDSRERFLPDFNKWCEQHGVKSEGLQIDCVPCRGFGLKTLKALEVGDLLIKVPFKCMLSLEFGKRSELKRALSIDPILQNMENVALAVLLANEKVKDAKSFWHFYVETLPKSFTSPLFFSTDELQLLKGSQYFDESLKMWRNICRQYAYFYNLLINDKSVFHGTKLNASSFTFDLYRWSTTAVMTRINFVPDQNADGKPTPVLIPFWDMANHDGALPVCTDFDDVSQCGLLYAGKSYEPGDEVCIFYGPRTNGEFFMHNGFVVDAGDDTCIVHLGLSKSDANFAKKEEALAKFGLKASETFVIRCDDKEVLRRLRCFANVFVANGADLENLKENVALFAESTSMKSKDFLKTRLECLLKYSYSPQSNIVEERSSNAVLALKIVEREKNVLRKTLELFN